MKPGVGEEVMQDGRWYAFHIEWRDSNVWVAACWSDLFKSWLDYAGNEFSFAPDVKFRELAEVSS